MELSTHLLVRKLCQNVARDATLDPQLASQIATQLFDTAFSALIGLHPELDVAYIAPDNRSAAVATTLEEACGNLTAGSYSDLASSLQALSKLLRREEVTAVLGTEVEQLSGRVPVLPLTEHDAVLAFLLGLQGSQLSVRRRQVTNQIATTFDGASSSSGAVIPTAVPLTSSVFSELPDPYALTDVSASTVVLLPSECGFPMDPFAGSADVLDLSSCMSSRPAWNPTALAFTPQPPAAAWLPVPPPLLEMRGDRRRGARPPPIGLPWALLSMGEAPGASTAFQPMMSPAGASENDDDGSGLLLDGSSSTPTAAAEGAAGVDSAAVQGLGGSCRLWSLEEADLARDALLALQGVHSALMRLRGVLTVPHALPRLSIQGILSRIAAAAELRQRLQRFVALHLSHVAGPMATAGRGAHAGSGQAHGHFVGDANCSSYTNSSFQLGAGNGSGNSASMQPHVSTDPVLRAFAAAVGEVLQRQVAALQALEREGASTWVRHMEVAGKPGMQFHRRGLTLLQVLLHTGRLQAQLQSLAALCSCLPHQHADVETEDERADEASAAAASGSDSFSSAQQWDSFPRGSALLSYLHQAMMEADDSALPTTRFLFLRALRPYLAHMRAWAFSPARLLPEFATRAEEAVAPCLEFTPLAAEEDGEEAGTGMSGNRPGLGAVPCDPPAFLQSEHAAFMRAGAQLRLLDSLPAHGKSLVAELASIAEHEAAQLQQYADDGSLPGSSLAAVPSSGECSLAVQPGQLLPQNHATLAQALPRAAAGGGLGLQGSWLALSGTGTAEEEAGNSLLLTSAQLQQAVACMANADTARLNAVEGWLQRLNLQRHQAEQAAAAEALGRTATMKERQQRAAARWEEMAAQQRSSKALLWQQQEKEMAGRRARLAMQRVQQQAEDRDRATQAALQEHSAALAELAAALAGTSLAAAASGQQQQLAAAEAQEADPAGALAAVLLPPIRLPAKITEEAEGVVEAAVRFADDDAVPFAELAAPIDCASHAALEAEPQLPAGPVAETGAVPRRQRERWQHIDTALGGKVERMLPALAAFQPPTAVQQGVASEEEEWAVPLSATLEMCVVQRVLSQYRAVSQACVRLFLEELKILEHLEALRRIFFLGAGDWADAFVGALAAHADTLEPLSQHALERLLQDSVRGTSLEEDPYARRMRVRLLPGLSTVNAQVQAVALPTPQKRGRARARARVPVSTVIPPTVLDGMDCIALDYDMGWPLSAVITEDIMTGYAAVFSMLVRLKRVEQLLRALHAPLMMQPKSTADVLLSEVDEDRAYRRLQRLRGFSHGAAQLVAAVQAFLYSRISGQEWVQLMAKLMISSEQVAVAVLSRGPSATITGALSRMSSMQGSGSAAHRLVKLAKALSRQGSRNLSRQSSLCRQGSFSLSQPGSPRPNEGPVRDNGGTSAAGLAAAAAAAVTAGAAVPTDASAPRAGGARPSRLGPSRLNSTVAGAAGAAGGSSSSWGGGVTPAAEAGDNLAAVPAATGAATATGAGNQIPLLPLLSAELPSGQQAMADVQQQQLGQQRMRGQEEGGIADLQQLLDLHRTYIRAASTDCLTLGGHPAARDGVDAALQAAMDFALRLQATVRLGAAGRSEGTWVQILRRDSSWAPLEEGMAAFNSRVHELQLLVESAGGRGVLAELALQLDYNGFYSSKRRARKGAATAAEVGVGAARV